MKILFKPPVSAILEFGSKFSYLYDHETSSIVFIHTFHDDSFVTLKSVLVYNRLVETGDFLLVKNTSALSEHVGIFNVIYDMKLLLLAHVGPRGHPKVYAYKFLFALSGNLFGQIIISKGNPCYRCRAHNDPSCFHNGIIIRCLISKQTLSFTLYTLTWSNGTGILSNGSAFPELKTPFIFITLDGRLIAVNRRYTGCVTVTIYHKGKGKSAKWQAKLTRTAYYTSGVGKMHSALYKLRNMFLVFFHHNGMMNNFSLFQILCFPSEGIIGRVKKFYKKINVIFKSPISLSNKKSKDEAILMTGNGDFILPAASDVRKIDEERSEEVYRYLEVFNSV